MDEHECEGAPREPLAERVRIALGKTIFTTLGGITAGKWWELLRENRFAATCERCFTEWGYSP